MKGVVRPHARPTRRKPSVQLRIEGEGGGDSVSVDMFALEVWWEKGGREGSTLADMVGEADTIGLLAWFLLGYID